MFTRSHAILHERGLCARLPAAAAIRHQYHRSEFIGGDVVVTFPPSGRGGSTHPSWGCGRAWTTKSTRRSSPILPAPIPTSCVRYEPDGLGLDVINAFPPTARTLRQFINSYHELLDAVTDAIRPNSNAKA